PRIAALPPPSNSGYGATANLPLTFGACCDSAYAYGQLRMNVALPASQARRAGSSVMVVTAFGAAPSLMPSTMNCRALRFSGELIVDFEPSSERTLPPAANASSRKLTVRPSYAEPW